MIIHSVVSLGEILILCTCYIKEDLETLINDACMAKVKDVKMLILCFLEFRKNSCLPFDLIVNSYKHKVL